MYNKLGKESDIKAEKERLMKIFECLDKNVFDTLLGLFDTAAYLTICLLELQKIINKNGYVEEYQNGECQKGLKQSVYIKIHTDYAKQQTSILKTLASYAPKYKKAEAFELAKRGRLA